MPVVTLPQFGATRLRSYILRLPLFTRCIIGIMVLLWIVSIQKVWDVQKWGALYPDEIGLSSSKQPISNSYILGF
jgi:glycosylphosphatidylinositol transamidase